MCRNSSGERAATRLGSAAPFGTAATAHGVCLLLFLTHPAFAVNRWIYDCGDPFGDTTCYLDVPQDGYFYGRSEGEPPRGPNPNHFTSPNGGDIFGSTDVDTIYDLTGQIHQYYTTVLGRNGPNTFGGTGNGTGIPRDVFRVFVNADFSLVGAQLCAGTVGLPAALDTTPTCVVCEGSVFPDIVAHEVAHIMATNMRQPNSSISLGISDEAGTLNEAMADFFGEAFERFLTGSSDWIAGTGAAIPVRSMSDPPSVPQGPYASPDRYSTRYTGSAGGGGAHINAGILNKAAYLAVEGGTFNGYTIGGIGFEKVEQTWYRGLTTYFVPDETLHSGAIKLVQATDDLYGQFEVLPVRQALRAVEIYPATPTPVAGDYNDDGYVDAADYTVWRNHLGETFDLVNENPDAETKGVVDWEDYLFWKSRYAEENGGGAGVTVPEPTTLVLLAIGVILVGTLRRM
ncbi:MAG: M4 family metallopeptidase [Pirellulales bacterium]